MNKLILSSKIYEFNTLEDAVNEFNGLADIRLQREESYFLLNFFNCSYDIAETMKEFENYLIELTYQTIK